MSGFNGQLQLAGVLEWMSQQMAGCGGKTAVIGISGGKDSSTVAARVRVRGMTKATRPSSRHLSISAVEKCPLPTGEISSVAGSLRRRSVRLSTTPNLTPKRISSGASTAASPRTAQAESRRSCR